jgi:hypothetical protein
MIFQFLFLWSINIKDFISFGKMHGCMSMCVKILRMVVNYSIPVLMQYMLQNDYNFWDVQFLFASRTLCLGNPQKLTIVFNINFFAYNVCVLVGSSCLCFKIVFDGFTFLLIYCTWIRFATFMDFI